MQRELNFITICVSASIICFTQFIITMQSAFLSQITIYPIKSTAGISLSNSWVDSFGLSFDRRFVLTAPNGNFITARTDPKLTLIQANLTATGLIITAPNMPTLNIHYAHFSSAYKSITVWHDEIQGQHCQVAYDSWFSDYLAKPCQLIFFGGDSKRYVKNSSTQVAFADGYPLLLISQASLAELNKRSPADVSMQQFRPNLVVEDCDAFSEDGWQHIRIGEVAFEIVKPCSRCIFTTVNPETGEFHPQQEPLNTLAKFRQGEDKEIYFGQNVLPLNTGQIKTGDTVHLIKRQVKAFYMETKKSQPTTQPVSTCAINNPPADTLSTSSPKKANKMKQKINITFASWDKSYTGNTKNTLLEQGEDAGLIMRYSCRGGSCGSCKVKLNSGNVEQGSTDGLTSQEQSEGYILACCAVPKSDVVISKD